MITNMKKGFTLIELMIVVAIIGILAAIAMPKYRDLLEKSREGATKGNIGAIKSAISLYYANNSGTWPDDPRDTAFKKYLAEIPCVKVSHPNSGFQLSGKCNDIEIDRSAIPNGPGGGHQNPNGWNQFRNNTDGWRYDPDSGSVWVNNSQTDTLGTCYTIYGYG